MVAFFEIFAYVFVKINTGQSANQYVTEFELKRICDKCVDDKKYQRTKKRKGFKILFYKLHNLIL